MLSCHFFFLRHYGHCYGYAAAMLAIDGAAFQRHACCRASTLRRLIRHYFLRC